MMEELTSAVASVLGLRRENKHVEALKQLDDLLNKQFRLRSDLLRRLPPEQIIELFRLGPGIEADKLQQVARILEEEAVIYLETSRTDEGIRILMKSLHLYLYSDTNGATRDLQVLPERIACIVKLVREYELPLKPANCWLFITSEKTGWTKPPMSGLDWHGSSQSFYPKRRRFIVNYWIRPMQSWSWVEFHARKSPRV